MTFRSSPLYSCVLIFCTLMFSIKGASQLSTEQQLANLRNITPPSPNASALGKYGEWPISLYTGVAGISIPIYELKGRSMSVPVSLSYHAAGNKVGDIASWVGLGWSLQAGGLISRSMRGLPDEQGYFANASSYSDPDDLSSTASTSITSPKTVASAKGTADTEEDTYYLNAMGKSYKLMLKSDGTVMTIPYSKIKFTKNPIVGTTTLSTDSSWVVLMEDGTKMIFGTSAFIEVTDNPNFTNADGTGITYNSSWYLKSITSPAGEVITFSYTVNSIQQDGNFSQSDYIKFLTGYNVLSRCDILSQSSSVNTIVNKLTVNSRQLSSIESDLCRIDFVADTAGRQDLKGGKSLSAIKIYSKLSGAYIGNYKFHYSYSSATSSYAYTTDISGGDLGYYEKRLRLDSLKQRNPLDTTQTAQKWVFNYHTQNLPSRRSYAQDHWGFFNGATTNTSLLPPEFFDPIVEVNAAFAPSYHETGANRNGRDTFMQAEILTSIKYPTGGSSKFFYEPNSVSTTEELFGAMTKNPLLSLYGSQSNTYTHTDSFRITKAQTVLIGLDVFVSQSVLNTEPGATGNALIVKSNGTQVGITLTGTGNRFVNLHDTGMYAFKINALVDPSSLAISSDHVSVEGTLNYQGSLGNQTYNKPVGGLRIKHIADYDSITTIPINDRYFQYSDPLVISPVDPVKDYLSDQTSSTHGIDGDDCYYTKTTRSSSTKFAMGSIQGGTVGYGTVTTLFGPNGENGKKVSIFSSVDDAHLTDAYNFPYPMPDSRDVRRGLLLHETDYDNHSTILHEVVNTYDFPFIKQFVGFKAGYNYLQAPFFCTNQYQNCGILLSYSYTTIEQVRQLTKIEKSYDQKGLNPINDTTYYYYDNANNLSPTRIQTINSKRDSVKTINRTALEKSDINAATTLTSTASAAIDTMLARNIISPVLQQEKYVGAVLQNRSLTNYKNWSSKSLQPENVQIQVKSNPVETRLQLIKYDTLGNLVEQRKSNDVKHDYIYDYNSTYPVCEVSGADTASIAYTSFESDGKGYWSYSSTPGNDYSAPTGKKIYTLTGSNNITKSGLTSGTTYIVSYWTKNSSAYSITGTISNYPISGRTVNGWKYFEHRITGQTTITVSGTGTIDELRLYPLNAQMTTYCYSPLVGMSSQCDANNRITYYEYDGFGRLILIRDQDRNIIKKICYNYAGQPENCTQFGNVLKTGTYTKNNCGTDSTGSSVIDSVMANTYYAATQIIADSLAQADVNANGQAYANSTGTCSPLVIYARVNYGGYYTDAITQYATVYIEFFSDYACTTPYSVTNLSVNYQKVKTLCGGGVLTTNYTQTCSGTSYSLGNQVIQKTGTGTQCYTQEFFVTAGTGYNAL